MCLTIPQKIIAIKKNKAVTKKGKEIDISLLPSLKKGDYVLSQSNIAVKKISKKEADNIFKVFSKFSSSKGEENLNRKP